MKKVLSLILVIIIFASTLSFNASAVTDSVRSVKLEYPALYASSDNATNVRRKLSKYVDLDDFKKVIFEAASLCSGDIDISRFNIPYSSENIELIEEYIWYNIPEAFHIWGLGVYGDNHILTGVVVSYRGFADTVAEFDFCYKKMVAAADKLLLGIENNNALDDVEKTLLLHDRLAIWNKYDYDRLDEYYQDRSKSQEIFTAYGALAQQGSVCQGYAMAYMYLLDRIDIENYYCSSETINHGWNIIYIDGKSYHVDVTWDDWDINRMVAHNNFLRSSDGIYSTNHKATDYDTTPTDTKYDNYFWQDYMAEFQLAGNEIYYVDSSEQVIKRYSDNKAICGVEAVWRAGSGSYWSGNYTYIASDGRSIFYSQPKSIYRFDLTTKRSEIIYTPSLGADESIFGFSYQDGTLICDISDTPNEAKRQITQKYKYDYDQDYDDGDDNVVDTQVTYGDVNSDGNINGRDYALLLQYLNDWSVTISIEKSDVNGDGDINGRDYALLLQYLNDWPVTLGPKA